MAHIDIASSVFFTKVGSSLCRLHVEATSLGRYHSKA